MLTVPRNAKRPKRAGSAARPPGPSSERSPAGGGGRPWPPVRGRSASEGVSSRATRGRASLMAASVRAHHYRRRLVLHDVVARRGGVAVLVRPAVYLRDLARPVPMGRRRGGGPFEAVRVPWVLAGPRSLERAPEEVDEEHDLGDAQDERAHRDELV